jgi:hypothetical protein
LQGISAITGFISKTAAYTLTTADNGKYVVCSGGNWTLTLPTPATGLSFSVRNDMGITGTTGTITVQPPGGTIDSLSSLSLLPQQECLITTDGTNWRTLGLKREVILGTIDTVTSTASVVVLLPVGYRYFEFEIDQIGVDADGNLLLFQLSSDGGSTWDTGNNYYDGLIYDSAATTVSYQVGFNPRGIFSQVQTTAANNANSGISHLRFFPGSGSALATWSLMSGGYRISDARQHSYWSQGFANGLSIRNAIKIYPSAGNITRAFLTVKGVV